MPSRNKQIDAAMRACKDAAAFSRDFLGWSMTPKQVAAMIEAALQDEFTRDSNGGRIRAKYRQDQNKRMAMHAILKERANANT